jgi:hypothetical protein
VDSREAPPDARQVRSDPAALLADAMAFDAGRLVGVEEQLAPAGRVSRRRQRQLRKPLVALDRAFAAEADVNLGRIRR